MIDITKMTDAALVEWRRVMVNFRKTYLDPTTPGLKQNAEIVAMIDAELTRRTLMLPHRN